MNVSSSVGVSHEELVVSALRALNADPGASMAQIASVAGVGRATLHRHFATRDDLIREIGERSIARWEASLRSSGVLDLGESADAAAYRSALVDLVDRYVQDAADFGFALTNPELDRDHEFHDRCMALVALETGVFAAAQRAGVFRDDLPAEWVGHVLFGLLKSAVDARHYESVAPRLIPGLVSSSFFAAVGR